MLVNRVKRICYSTKDFFHHIFIEFVHQENFFSQVSNQTIDTILIK